MNQKTLCKYRCKLYPIDCPHAADELTTIFEHRAGDAPNCGSFVSKDDKDSVLAEMSPYFDARGKFMPKLLGDEVLAEYHIITFSDTREIAVYQDGVYVIDGGEDIIRLSCLNKLGDQFKRDRIAEVLEYVRLKTLTSRAAINQATWKINVKNGMYDVDNDKLVPHSPEYLSTIQLPITYDPKAQCVKIDKFFYEVAGPEDVLVLIQFAGYCCVPDISQQKALLLDGAMNNGKSTFIELVCTMVGQENVSEQGLQDLNSDRFSRAQLNGKLVNMFPDLPKTKLYDNSVFKMLTSDQWIDGEEKYLRKFRFQNITRQIYSANKIPEVDDPDELAFFRRWICITFPNSFEGRENKNLINELTMDEELAGFFNVAMVGLRALLKNDGFCYSKSVADVQKIYLTKSDPTQAFLDECTETSNRDIVKKGLYETFVEWCKSHEITNIMKDNAFGRKLKKLGYVDGRLTNSSRDHVWLNLGYVVQVPTQVIEKTWTDENKPTDTDKKSSCPGSQVTIPIVEKYRGLYSSVYISRGVCSGKPGYLGHDDSTESGRPFESKKTRPGSKNNLGRNLDGLDNQADRMNKLSVAVKLFEKLNGPLSIENYKAFASNYVQNTDLDYEQVLTDLRHGWNISEPGKLDQLGSARTAAPVITIRALRDLPCFAGADGTVYELKGEDIEAIPQVNAMALIKRKVAVEVPGVPT